MKTSNKSVADAVGSYLPKTTFFGKILFYGRRRLKITLATLSVVPTALLLLTPSASAQESGAVGIKFTSPTSYDGSATTLLPTDAAGALQVTNWNNYFLNGAFPAVQ